ncbi:MAG: SulP family inorganic anion transporter [Betaproteobacteria bacterium]
MASRLFPFRAWFPMTRETLRADAVAGMTVALILIPQSMAYAQLAGMPAYYGLYAAFLPVMVGALWGSSNQLSTGPVAMVSLLTGSTLAQFASPGTEQFITYAILLAFMAGLMQLVIGAFRLGAVINFLSHPVVVGFTNAAAIIIALSQINKMLGVPIGRSEHFLLDVWTVLQQIGEVHIPTLGMGLSALALIVLLRRFRPAWPGVLITVVLCTLVSWAIQFERNVTAGAHQFEDVEVRNVIDYVAGTARRFEELNAEIEAKLRDLKLLEKNLGEVHPRIVVLTADIEILRLDARTIEREHRLRMRELRRFVFERMPGRDGEPDRFYLVGTRPHAEKDGRHWRITRATSDGLELAGGGEVVGRVPSGLPALSWPKFNWDLLVTLLPSALVITLVGFMETISVAKAMATRTRQRIDPDQELIGQGLANIAGSLSSSFPVSGSFSRSAVNLGAGAVTGFSSVVAGVLVVVTLLLLTPLLYHLPQAVLAAVIMAAVGSLINFRAIRHAWSAQRHDGIAAVVAFVATLGFAPHLDTGILVGGALAIVLFLYRTMRPRIAVLSRHPDGTLRDARLHGLPTSDHIIVIRFDGSLYFANVPYFEEALLQEAARSPRARYILIVADGINEIDGSGVEAIRHMVDRLKSAGVAMVFSGLKMQVLQVMEKTGLHALIGVQNFFRTEEAALDAIYRRIEDPSFDEKSCPLSVTPQAHVLT